MTPQQLAEKITRLLLELRDQHGWDIPQDTLTDVVNIERPKNRQHGDWSVNAAMRLAKTVGMNPRELGQIMAQAIGQIDGVSKAEVAGPGFINICLEVGAAATLVTEILNQGEKYGSNDSLKSTNINLEYVSANPTGPIHLGGARWAAVGDSLARLLTFNGADVTREYYFNDHGSQIDRFARSLLAAAKGLPAPEDGYGGAYIQEIADQVTSIARESGDEDPMSLPTPKAVEYYRRVGVELMFDQIKERLSQFRTEFDVYFHEDSLHTSGAVQKAIEQLRARNEIVDRDGAVWLLSTKYGDDKDRVLIKSDGQAAYFAGDVAYYLDKRRRGAQCAIYLLGADHHGYIGRMMAMCAAFGDEPGVNMQILIGQLVNLFKGGQPVRMSKRAGNIVTLDDFVEAVGVDAARYSLVRSSIDTTLDIDLDVLTTRSNDNPVYYVQYAHARTCSVERNAKAHGVEGEFIPTELSHSADSELLGVLASFPRVVSQGAQERSVHLIARYVETLAGAYHAWYNQCRVTPVAGEAVKPEHVARLYLNNAVRQVIANGLTLLGVDAPERM